MIASDLVISDLLIQRVMNLLPRCFLLSLATVFLIACSSSDPLLEAEPKEPISLALAKPIIPDLNQKTEQTGTEETTENQQEVPPAENASKTDKNNDQTSESILPPKLENKQSSPPTPDNQTTASSPPPSEDPRKRVPSTTASEPCNAVHKDMIASMEGEINDLQSYYEGLTELIERHKIRREIREKKKDLDKYKKDHGCK